MRALALAAVLALIGGVAVARMPAGGPTPEAEWFRSLKQPGNGASCCSIADCHRVDVDHVRTRDGKLFVLATREEFGADGDGQLHEIPDEKLIRGRDLAQIGGNPVGTWIICSMRLGNGFGTTDSLYIMCAVPPSQT